MPFLFPDLNKAFDCHLLEEKLFDFEFSLFLMSDLSSLKPKPHFIFAIVFRQLRLNKQAL